MKRKLFSILLTVAFVAGLIMIPAAPAGANTDYNVTAYTLDAVGTGTSVWSTAQAKTGSSSVLLTHAADGAGSVYVQFVPLATETLASFQDDIDAVTGNWSFEWWMPDTGVVNGPQFELYFDDPDSTGWLEVTAVGLQGTTGTGNWVKETLAGATLAGYGGWGEAGSGAGFFNWSPLTALTGIEAAVNGEGNVTDASDWVLTRVRVELWESTTLYSYIDDIEIAGVTYYGLIQEAIGIAGAGDTITVAAGTYDEQLEINNTSHSRINLTLIGDVGDTSAGPGTSAPTLQPTASPDLVNGDVHIYSDGVDIKGFILDFNGTAGTRLGYGILVQAADVEIRDNEFQLALGDNGHSTVAGYGIDAAGAMDISSLVIDRNTFIGATTAIPQTDGSVGVHMNPSTGSDVKTVSNNVFSGPLYGGVSFHTGYVNVTDNVMTGIAATPTIGTFGVHIGSEATGAIGTITVSGNDISQFGTGIDVFEGSGAVTVTILDNIVEDNTEGIYGGDNAMLTITYNDIVGNTDGVIDGGSGTLTALYNYWGDPSGPTVTTNARGAGDTVTVTDITYEPWLHTTKVTVYPSGTRYYAYNWCDLTTGWNIWSTPIEPPPSADTWGEYTALGNDLDLAGGSDAYYFNGSTQSWANPGADYALHPCDAIYVKVASSEEAPILFSPDVSAPSKTLYAGWNLVSASYIDDMDTPYVLNGVAPETALASVYYVPGANNIGYSQVVSPATGQTGWVNSRGAAIDTSIGSAVMLPCLGYWVYMINSGGTLAGAVFTPVSPLLP